MIEIEDFKNFFVGNYKSIGMQYGNGKWISGDIFKATFEKCTTIEEAMTLHLQQEITIGSYPYYQKNNIWYCKYICIDIDSHDQPNIQKIKQQLEPLTLLIVRYLVIEFSVPADSILREFSGEGYHIWIKLKPFTTLKRAFDLKIHLESILKKRFNLNAEIFPKQDENIKDIKRFGNCCKVPLSINRKNGRFCKILDDFDLSQQGKGYYIPNWIPQRPKLNLIKGKFTQPNSLNHSEPIQIKPNNILNYFLDRVRPCMRAVILGEVFTHHHPSGNGHWFNIMVCNTLYHLGASRDIRVLAFKNQPDFEFAKSEKQVTSLEKDFNPKYVKNLSCKTIRKKGFCLQNCPYHLK